MSDKTKISLIASSLSLIMIYAASSSPISYYSLYLSIQSISKATLSYSVASFFIGTMLAVLVLGRISDYYGRKRISVLSLIISIIGCALFYFIDGSFIFLMGRFIQGLACGLAITNISSYIVDVSINKTSASKITSTGSMFGLSLGTLSSGIFAEICLNDISEIFLILIIILILCIILISISEEPIQTRKLTVNAVKPSFKIPDNIKRLFIPTAPVFIASWALCGFYQGFSSSIAFEIFNIDSTLITAIFFASITVSQIFGSELIDNLGNTKSQKSGMIAFSIILVMTVASLKLKLLIPFIILTLFGGACIGLSFTSSVDSIISKVSQKDYGNAFSAIYFISYAGIGVINITVGQIANQYSLIQILIGYAIFTIISTLIVLSTIGRVNYE